MDRERSPGCGSSSDASRLNSSIDKVGDRTRFMLALRQGETTIVSWKKMMKDVTKTNAQAPALALAEATFPGNPVHPALESRLSPVQVQPASNDPNDAAPSNRMSGVIEKIERLFMGNGSSDEDLNNIPDDDQYDTQDSFIDDAELNEYFEVDKSKTKHDGFFVNRGKLKSIEHSLSPDQLPKKRRRAAENDGDGPNKLLKVGRKSGGRRSLTVGNNSMPASPTLSDSALIRHQHRSLSSHFELQSGKANCMEDSNKSTQHIDKFGRRVQFDLNIACGAQPIHTAKTSHAHRKDGSGMRTKSNMLEKAIRELEKTVAECRPRNGELPGVDATAQGIKRRLPQEIKYKLAKVARAVHAHGKVSKELLSRLMNIVGHVINLRTLKRNLKILINTSLSTSEEKHGKYQRIKNEIVDMISTQAPLLAVKAGEQQDGDSDDFQQPIAEEKGAENLRSTIDASLEDKICDLYDIFVDGLDENGAPQVRTLYAELAELWPKGVMDNDGIKRAIRHAKDRRRELQDRNKDAAERIRGKKFVIVNAEETVHTESSSGAHPGAHPQYKQERVTEVGTLVRSTVDRSRSNASAMSATAPTVATTTNPTTSANIDRPKHEKLKGSVTGVCSGEMRPLDTPAPLMKKKVKRRPDANLGEINPRLEKVSSQHRPHKDHSSELSVGELPLKASIQSASMTGFEQLS